MTEYWVSQGNKWCDFCKIFISNNPATIRNHELGQRHKDNVAKRLNDMRKEKAAKEKEEKEAIRTLQQIEAKAKKSYQKDVANFQEARDTNSRALDVQGDGEDKWEYDNNSKYYYNPRTGLHYDPNSGFYYSDKIGRWVTREEAYAALPVSGDFAGGASVSGRSISTSNESKVSEKGAAKLQTGPPPGPVVSGSLNPMRSIKGAASSVAIKRKRQDGKTKAISKEEAEALKAREAAKKRVEEREKPLLGLYRSH